MSNIEQGEGFPLLFFSTREEKGTILLNRRGIQVHREAYPTEPERPNRSKKPQKGEALPEPQKNTLPNNAMLFQAMRQAVVPTIKDVLKDIPFGNARKLIKSGSEWESARILAEAALIVELPPAAIALGTLGALTTFARHTNKAHQEIKNSYPMAA